MKTQYTNLFSPIKIGNITFKNRIIAAPTSLMNLTPEGHLTSENIAYYELKAKGGCAAVTIGESIVDSKTGKSHDQQISLDDPHVLPCLSTVVKAINRYGAVANIELSHGGKYAGLASIGGDLVNESAVAYGPSEAFLPTGEHIYEMPKEVIYHIIDSFGTAAAKVKRAGFEIVMVHAGHGWLFGQFLSPAENKRKDEFGGSLENRARFLRLALDSVRKAVGPGFPIQLRMNGEDFIEGGMHLEDYKELAKMLDSKVDLFNISCGMHDGENLFVRTHPSMFLDRGCNVYLAAAIKEVVTKPVSCVGSLNDPAQCEEIIASGKADMVEMARALLADPELPKKAYVNNASDITPCLRCFACFDESVKKHNICCSVNPVIGNELNNKMFSSTPKKLKNVLIVGGGPGGMQAAITAASRGHKVTLCEASDSLGGSLKFAKHVPFKKDLFDFEQLLERRLAASSTKVLLNTKVTKEYVEKMQPDTLIIAAGATPFIPPIPGIDSKHVLLATDAESDSSKIGNKVVILGGGLVGCETAINLSKQGKNVTIIEMRSHIAPDANDFHKMAMEKELKDVNIKTNTTGKYINRSGIMCTSENGEEAFLEANTIICAVGVKPCVDVVEELINLTPEYFVIGDCKRPRQVTQAISEAYYSAIEL
jgi:2,4-dienoyl-CoA reductase-like NADH-dependent reductase (Old Yellow Enzyme family)/thioredoxin reductase